MEGCDGECPVARPVFTVIFSLSSLPICGDTRLPAAWDSWGSSHGNRHVLKRQVNIPGYLCLSRCLLWPHRTSRSHHTITCWAPSSSMCPIKAQNTRSCESAPQHSLPPSLLQACCMLEAEWCWADTHSQGVNEMFKKSLTAKFLPKSTEITDMDRKSMVSVSVQALPIPLRNTGRVLLKSHWSLDLWPLTWQCLLWFNSAGFSLTTLNLLGASLSLGDWNCLVKAYNVVFCVKSVKWRIKKKEVKKIWILIILLLSRSSFNLGRKGGRLFCYQGGWGFGVVLFPDKSIFPQGALIIAWAWSQHPTWPAAADTRYGSPNYLQGTSMGGP